MIATFLVVMGVWIMARSVLTGLSLSEWCHSPLGTFLSGASGFIVGCTSLANAGSFGVTMVLTGLLLIGGFREKWARENRLRFVWTMRSK